MSEVRRANAAAAVVILLAGALSAVWAFLVPIFQAPDEPAHFDYAASIYGARRLIRLSDGRADWIVSPYTKYLLKALDFSDLAMNSKMRAPAGYGSEPYFARLDAGAPSLKRRFEPQGSINYIVPAYPFGFYALEAAWMHVVALFTGSLVALFFSARILCVFLLMVGLYFNYRTALNLGVPRWTSVALIAGIGFFPMTSFVSSYVQPDNLAYALVSASLFFATTLRSKAPRAANLAPLAASLGLLAITKYQCFAVVALPVVFAVGFRAFQTTRNPTPTLGRVFGLIAPAAFLLAVQHWVVGHSNAGGGSAIAVGLNLDYIRSVIQLGFSATAFYVTLTAAAAFIDFFISGGCAATFWQVFGWGDTPIFIVNGTIELWIRALIGLGTVEVAVAVAFLVVRNSARIASAWERGHRRLALNAVSADPVFASYLLFVALMFALYIATNNAFGAEGRHWYAFIFPAFLFLVWYAPAAFRARKRAVSAVLAAALCCYSLVAAGYALSDVAQRYYGPRPRLAVADPKLSALLPGSTGVLWAVKSAEYHVADNPVPVFRVGTELIDSGAALPLAPNVPSAIAATLDGKPIPVVAGEYQFTLAEATRDLADAYSQFYTPLRTNGLREGVHVVAAYARAPDGRHYRAVGVPRVFFLTAGDGRFSSAFLQSLHRAPRVFGSLDVVGACKGLASGGGYGESIDTGGIALVVGAIAELGLDPYRGAWLLIDGRPYQARYDAETRTFEATIPTTGLRLGTHRIFAYAVRDEPAHPVQIGESTMLSVVPGNGASEYPSHPLSECSDPSHQLAGLDT